ncbi:hypothetical protein NDU88_009594 [Pleurodeles waltl]|uniref:Uncharacterized protein n=1 Tax=Pleurodeles waltl TaxID=8319 RepID=A0AAV7RYU2_PLEWA|nr:hypothetical protein NDU88_009594 [Pleurodeles waltl]
MFLFALRRLGPKKQPMASLGEAWRLSPHRAAPPGVPGAAAPVRARLRRSRGRSRAQPSSRGAAAVWHEVRPWPRDGPSPLAAPAAGAPGIEG